MIASLTADKLACTRGSRRLFEGLSFKLAAGQVMALEGANGSGKTSLLRLIAGFLPATAGRVFLTADDRDIVEDEERRRRVGWLGHHDALKSSLSVAEQLTFFGKLYEQRADQVALLEEVGLTRQAELPCRYLSAGQRRRLALARLLLSARPLWLLDEPFAALDPVGKSLVARLISLHCAQGGIVIAATHEPLGLSNESIRL
jgi:heme exporter protein A